MKPRFGYDDALDVVGVHAVGGIWGALATGLFASVAVNAAGAVPAVLRPRSVLSVVAVAAACLGGAVLLVARWWAARGGVGASGGLAA